MSREQIITQLMEKHYGKIYQCLMNDARRLGAGPLLTETEDCIQEALLLLYDQWPKYETTENLPGWLYITALNTLKNRRRLYRAREKTVTASWTRTAPGSRPPNAWSGWNMPRPPGGSGPRRDCSAFASASLRKNTTSSWPTFRARAPCRPWRGH